MDACPPTGGIYLAILMLGYPFFKVGGASCIMLTVNAFENIDIPHNF